MVSILNNAYNLLVYRKLSTWLTPVYRPSKSLFIMIKVLAFFSNFVAPLLFFSIDLGTLSLAHTPLLHTLAVFTLVSFLQPRVSFSLLFYLLFLALFSCITTGLALPYIALLTSIFLLTKGLSFYTPHQLLLCTGSVFALTFASLEFFATPDLGFCTIVSLAGNLIAMNFSLKWFSAVKRGNRS